MSEAAAALTGYVKGSFSISPNAESCRNSMTSKKKKKKKTREYEASGELICPFLVQWLAKQKSFHLQSVGPNEQNPPPPAVRIKTYVRRSVLDPTRRESVGWTWMLSSRERENLEEAKV